MKTTTKRGPWSDAKKAQVKAARAANKATNDAFNQAARKASSDMGRCLDHQPLAASKILGQ